MRILLVNPNSSAAITERLVLSAQRALRSDDQLTAITAKDAPKAITQPHEVEAASHRVVDMVLDHAAGQDAAIVGISLDCGVDRVRQRLGNNMPVIGMTEAACLMACAVSTRFGLLTLGQAMGPLYDDHVQRLGLKQRLAGLRAPDLPQAFGLAPDQCPAEIIDSLTHHALELVQLGAKSVVLAGAVLCGYSSQLQARLGIPVMDGITCATLLARNLMAVSRDSSV